MAPKRRNSSRAAAADKQYAEEEHSDLEVEDEEMEDAEPLQVQEKLAKKQAAVRRPAKRAKAAPADVGQATLLDIVVKHSDSTSLGAKEWVNRYREDRAAATGEVLSLLVQAGGSDMVLTGQDAEDGEVDRLVQTLITSVSREGFLDLFKAKGLRNFREHYLEMWDHLLREAHAQELLLTDDYLLDTVSHLVIGLNCSVVRSFRYTATLTACQIVTSLVRVILALTEARETAVRQKEAEERKKGGKERAQAFQRTISACQRQIQGAKDVISNLFQAVTAHRFRDVAEDIRAVVISGIGSWIKLHPAEFLQDNYLKYIAWALSDKDALVRDAAIEALLALYAVPDHLSPLHDFTERFKARFCELIDDVNDAVAIKGVQLVTTLVKMEELEPEAVREVYRLLVDSAAGIRHAAADLVAGLLEEQGARFLASQQQQTPQKGRKKQAGSQAVADKKELQLAGVLHIMHLLGTEKGIQALAAGDKRAAGTTTAYKSLDPILVGLLVEALLDGHRVEILEDWRALADALLDDTACERRGKAATTNLALLLRDSLNKAVGAGPAGAAGGPGRGPRGRAGGAAATARQDATLALLKALPQLLRKFQTDAPTVAPLAGLVRGLKLEVYSLKREEAELDALLALLADLALKLREDDAILECLTSLHHCASEGPDALRERGQAVWNNTTGKIANKVEAAVEELLALSDEDLQEAADEEEEEACEEAHAARAALYRVHHMLLLAPPGAQADKLSRTLQKLLTDASKERAIPVAVLEQGTLAMFLLLLWKLKGAEEAGARSPSSSPRAASVGSLGKAVKSFVEQLDSILANSASERARDVAFCALCDLILVFDSAKLEGLGMAAAGFVPSEAHVENMWAQCEDILGREVPTDDDPDEPTEAHQAACARIVDFQVKALTAVARLVAFQALPNWEDLAAGVLSHLAGHDKRVCDVARDLYRRLKTTHPQSLHMIFVAALQIGFLRLQAASGAPEATEQFRELCGRVAALHAPPAGVPSGSLLSLMQHCLGFISPNIEERLDFFQGMALMAHRLAKEDAEELLKKAQAVITPARSGRTDGPWAACLDFIGALQERVHKGRAAAAPTPATAAKRAKRKAPLAHERRGRNSDSEISDAEVIEEDAEGGLAAMEHEDEVEEEEEQPSEPASAPASPAWRTRKGKSSATARTPAGKPPGKQAAKSASVKPPEDDSDDEIEAADDDDDADDEVDVEELDEQMPPEEELPHPKPPAARGRSKPRKPLARVYEDDEGADEGQQDEDMDDEDLIGPEQTSSHAPPLPPDTQETGGAPLRNKRRRH